MKLNIIKVKEKKRNLRKRTPKGPGILKPSTKRSRIPLAFLSLRVFVD
tara:strand:+ start:644 stop:787 length:144 start_codon:yes stop_codon:yes gene_type:complete